MSVNNISDVLKEGLKNMKVKHEAKGTLAKEPVESLEEGYPWGLEVRLEEDALKALGKSAEDFKVGEEEYMIAKVKVVSIRKSAGEKEYQNSECVECQIVEMKFQQEG